MSASKTILENDLEARDRQGELLDRNIRLSHAISSKRIADVLEELLELAVTQEARNRG